MKTFDKADTLTLSQKIVDSESQYEAQYYAEGEMESENTGFMASSMVSEAEREQFIAEHSRYLDDTHSPPVPATVTTGVNEEVAAKIRIKPLSIPRMRILLVAVGTRYSICLFRSEFLSVRCNLSHVTACVTGVKFLRIASTTARISG